MKIDFKLNLTTVLVIILAAIIFFFWNGKKNDEISRWENNYIHKSNEVEFYESRIDGMNVAFDRAISIKDNEIRKMTKRDSVQRELVKKYRHLALLNKTETKFVIDTVFVYVPIDVGTESGDTTVTLDGACFKADLSLSKGLLSLNNIDIQNTQDIAGGLRKNGLWKSEYAIDVRNSNECIQITGMTTYVVVKKKKWWENPLITGGAGILTGLIISNTLN